MKSRRTALPTRPEPLEARIAPATLIALTESDSLLRFDSATPGTITTVTVTGLGASEDLVGIDFRPGDGRLYGLTIDGSNAGRLYTLSAATGVATLVAALSADPADASSPFNALSGTSFGFDFNPLVDRMRVVSDTGQSLRINPTSGLVITDTDLNPGTPDVGAAAYTNSFPGATSTTLFDIDPTTDQLLIQNPPNNGTLTAVGSGLGVDATGVAGFDIGHGKNESFAALTVGGTTGLYRIDLTTGAATLAGSIGAGTTALRGLAVVQHTWDGDGGNSLVNNGANWVAGLAPAAGDSLIFPAGAANKTVFYNLPNLTAQNAIRITSDGYSISGSSAPRILDGIYVTHTTGTTNFPLQPVFGAQNGASATVNVATGAALVFGQFSLDGSQGLDFTGGGTVEIFLLGNPVDAGANIVVNGPAVTVDFLDTNRGVALQGGSLSVGKVQGQTRFAPVTVTGGALLGGGDLGAVTVNGGALFVDASGITVNGAFNLGAGGTAELVFPAAPDVFDPLEVKGTVTLAGNLDFTVASTSAPPIITLISNDGSDAVSGTFTGLAEGAIIPLLGRDYTLSYAGGDGNDVTLTAASAPITILPGGKSATFTDVDGDLVTVAITKGDLNDAQFSLRDAGGGRAQLELIDFLGNSAFAGTNITLTAKRQGTNGDGNVNIGYINATNLDLGVVKITGDLGAIDAGDATPATMALKSLAVHSLGVFGLSTGAPDLESDLDGRVGSIAIRGDLREASLFVFDRTKDTGDRSGGSSGDGEAFINALTIGGNIIGGAGVQSGSILVRDGILNATIGGNIIGGSGLLSGVINSVDGLGKFTVRGSVIGGSGDSSGRITASTEAVESLTVLGCVIGGSGLNSGALRFSDFDNNRASGSFFLGGSLVGGSGSQSGEIDFDGPVKKASIMGDILGGSGQFSGLVEFEEFVGTFLLGGSVVAGAANFTAQLGFEKSAGSLTILGSIIGAEGTFSAQVEVDDDLGKLTLGGSVIGGGQGSGQLDVGTLKSGTIRGSIVGGAGQGSGQIDADGIASLTVGSFIGGAGADSGTLSNSFGAIDKLKVLGSIVGGSGDRSGQIMGFSASATSIDITGSILSGTGATSGSILIGRELGKLKVGGEIRGTADDPVTVTGGGNVPGGTSSAIGIGSLTVGGGVTHARILAGHDAALVGRNADAVIGSVTVGGDWIASSLIAGLAAGADTFFGTADDALISGGGTTNDTALTSRIGSVTIKGQVLGTPGAGGGFGIAAQQIGSLKAGPVSYSFTANADAFVLGATGDFFARELGAANPVAGPAGPTATLVNPTTVTFTDVDGDLVTVKVTKGTLELSTNFVFAAAGVGQQLQRLVLTDAEFSGTALTITAKRSASGGDGSVNVGFINASGVDLGTVKIAGDLGSIMSGDATTKSVGLVALNAQSLGVFGTTTGAFNLSSIANGGAGSVSIRGSILDATFLANDSTGAGNGNLGKLTIGGSLVGGNVAGSATISAADMILNSSIRGSVIGGSGLASGSLLAPDGFGAVTLGGSLIGGGGAQSARIGSLSGDAKSVAIGGHILGATGIASARVFIQGSIGKATLGGSLIGGSSTDSGGIVAFTRDLTSISVGGDVIGGAGTASALIDSEGAKVGTVLIKGSVIGRAGMESANLEAGTGFTSVTIGGVMMGGAGENSGAIDAGSGGFKVFKLGGSLVGYRGPTVGGGVNSAWVDGQTLGAGSVGGSIHGGVSLDAGLFYIKGKTDSITIKGSLVGGIGDFTGTFFSDGGAKTVKVGGDIIGSGGTQSGNIGSDVRLGTVTVGGSVFSGSGSRAGAILCDGDIQSLTVKGSLIGTAANAVRIVGENNLSAGTGPNVGLGKVVIGGSIQFARIVAGDSSPVTPGVSIGSVSIGGDVVASSIVASVLAGTDTFFGTADDTRIGGAAAASGRIASILVKGQLLGTPGGTDAFGFVAGQINKLKIGSITYPLTTSVDVLVLGSTGDFNAREDAL